MKNDATIYGTGIVTYIKAIHGVNVCIYTIPDMDGLGVWSPLPILLPIKEYVFCEDD